MLHHIGRNKSLGIRRDRPQAQSAPKRQQNSHDSHRFPLDNLNIYFL